MFLRQTIDLLFFDYATVFFLTYYTYDVMLLQGFGLAIKNKLVLQVNWYTFLNACPYFFHYEYRKRTAIITEIIIIHFVCIPNVLKIQLILKLITNKRNRPNKTILLFRDMNYCDIQATFFNEREYFELLLQYTAAGYCSSSTVFR